MNIPLNIDWQQILLHLFNFSILVGGLYLLLFKPVKNFMDKRAKHYQDMENAAAERERTTAEMEASMQQRQAALDAELEEKRAAASEDMYAGFTSFSPNRLMRFVPWSTASRMASCTDSDFPCPGTSREPASRAAVISSHPTRNLVFFFFSILLSPSHTIGILCRCVVSLRHPRHGALPVRRDSLTESLCIGSAP